MRAVSRISHGFAFAGLVAASALIGWVARSSWADNLPRHPLILTGPPLEKVEGPIPCPPIPEILELAQATPPVQPAITEAPVPGDTPLGIVDPKPADHRGLTAISPVPQPLSPVPVGVSSSADPAAELAVNPPTSPESEDPEEAVQSFVEQNQKVAETQLKNLRDEQAKLRARLRKVEAGVKRWEALVEALKLSKKGPGVSSEPRPQVVPGTTVVPGPNDETPDVLDAIPKARSQPVPRVL
jgi:hypothetical protein